MLERILNLLLHREDIGGDGHYLTRWVIYHRKSGRSCYLHKFMNPDRARDPHDHNKIFVSIGLCGGYIELTYVPVPTANGQSLLHYEHHYKAPFFRIIKPAHIHRIVGFMRVPTWTLVFSGKTVREWGFYTPSGWMEWREYLHLHGEWE